MAARPPGSSDTAMVRIAPRLLQSSFALIRLQELRLEPGNRVTATQPPQAPHTLRVHPNPTQGTVSLFPEPTAPTPCQVQDNLGRTVWTGLYQPGKPIDLRHLPPGAYLLRLQGAMPRQGWFVRQ